MSLRDHLRPEEDRAVGGCECGQAVGELRGIRGDVRIQAEELETGQRLGELLLEPLRAGPSRASSAAPHTGQRDGLVWRHPQWWQCSAPSP
jgi:hypothetical protein